LAFVRKETEPGGFLAARFMAEPSEWGMEYYIASYKILIRLGSFF
jgi:hypothetical protein